ncbi:hypothetical protein [Youngiibacter fragilis]|uniref:Uncharacterized protein n=1 Tax=Youngiibacter fragilis 232.1 TaxID=994573 RepID=V7HZI2_9CLOT|nr:hypothetical protein [Youngiibacter fragilis]ETA79038.1 hypothetical protein T472_0218790 [Youngiibacter fragilis 232.1]
METGGRFSFGLLLGAIGYLVSSLVISMFLLLLVGAEGEFMPIFSGLLGTGWVVWLPLSIAIGSVSKRRGGRQALWFATAALAISLLVVGGCWGMITRY